MISQYTSEMKNLYSQIKIRELSLRNRIVVSPMQQLSASDGIPQNWHMVHLGSRAVGGAGLIITECTAVSPTGRNYLSDTGLNTTLSICRFVHKETSRMEIIGAKGYQHSVRTP